MLEQKVILLIFTPVIFHMVNILLIIEMACICSTLIGLGDIFRYFETTRLYSNKFGALT